MKWLKVLLYRMRGETPPTSVLMKDGMTVGKNFSRQNGVFLDPGHCWLIHIGDNVTMAPYVRVLAHDASTKLALGYTKIGQVNIGNNVFIGSASVILPNVSIGNNVIIGANATVTHDIPDNSVAAGSPAKVICTYDEYIEKMKSKMESAPCYGEDYTVRGEIDHEKKKKMNEDLAKSGLGFVV